VEVNAIYMKPAGQWVQVSVDGSDLASYVETEKYNDIGIIGYVINSLPVPICVVGNLTLLEGGFGSAVQSQWMSCIYSWERARELANCRKYNPVVAQTRYSPIVCESPCLKEVEDAQKAGYQVSKVQLLLTASSISSNYLRAPSFW
jgi:hypothetical protein